MRVLIVEDEPRLADQLRTAVADAGHAVDVASDGEIGLHLGASETYNAVVLDLGLPKLDGLSVLRRWRASGHTMPVVVLTARGSWAEKVDGLNAGADDYMSKPFAIAELLARINALIRRTHGHAQPVLSAGSLTVDTILKEVKVGAEPVRLTSLEFELLSVLALRPGQPVSKAELTEQLYAQDFDRDSNTLEVIVSRLRRKLGGRFIETQRGMGYRLAVPAPDA